MGEFLLCTIVSEESFENEKTCDYYCSCRSDYNDYTIEKRYRVKDADEEFSVDLVYYLTGTPGCCGSKRYRVVKSCC